MAGECHGKLSAGIHITEKDIGHGLPAPFPGIPRLYDPGNVLCDPGNGQGTAVDKDHDGGGARGVHPPDQLLLQARQLQCRHIVAFTRRPFPPFFLPLIFSQDHNGDLGTPCSLYSLVNLVQFVTGHLTPFHIADLPVTQFHPDPVQDGGDLLQHHQ